MKVIISRYDGKDIILKVRNNCLEVNAPNCATIDDIDWCIKNNQVWVNQHMQCDKPNNSCSRSRHKEQKKQWGNVLQGYSIKICGEDVAVESGDVRKTKYFETEHKIVVPHNIFINKSRRMHDIRSVLRKVANQKIPKIISQVGSQYSICPSGINIIDSGGRYWYDKSKTAMTGELFVDYRLIILPQDLQVYLIAKSFAYIDEVDTTSLHNYICNNDNDQLRIAEYQDMMQLL